MCKESFFRIKFRSLGVFAVLQMKNQSICFLAEKMLTQQRCLWVFRNLSLIQLLEELSHRAVFSVSVWLRDKRQGTTEVETKSSFFRPPEHLSILLH